MQVLKYVETNSGRCDTVCGVPEIDDWAEWDFCLNVSNVQSDVAFVSRVACPKALRDMPNSDLVDHENCLLRAMRSQTNNRKYLFK
jgi:hypothetical protein